MKSVCLFSGILILVVSCLLATFGGNSFALHMVTHMAIVAVAAPLIACGVTRTLLDISARLTWVTPLTASLIELITVMFWHLPQIRFIADQLLLVSALEQLSFLTAGLLLWRVCLSASPLAGATGLLFTSMHMTLVGVLLALAPRPLYGVAQAMCLGFPLAAQTDQQIGGVAMLLVGALSYLIGGIVLLRRLVMNSAETGPVP